MAQPTVAIIGASSERRKYGNKSLRAHQQAGYQVFPVHPHEEQIEGLQAYASVSDIPDALDRVSMYVPPHVGITLLEEIAAKGCREFWLNPGSESPELVAKARRLGLEPILDCSIVDLGLSPAQFPA